MRKIFNKVEEQISIHEIFGQFELLLALIPDTELPVSCCLY